MIIYLKLLLTAFFWGGTFVAGRMLSDNMGPCSAAFLRFAIASFFLFLMMRKTEGKIFLLKKSQIIPVILLGLTGVFFYNIFFFKALKLINAGRASLIVATNPIFIILLSSFLFNEKLNLIKIIGIILSVFGAFITISKGDLSRILAGGIGLGDFYIFVSVFCWVSFSLIGKSVVSDISPLISISWSSAIGSAALFLPACSEGFLTDFILYTKIDWFSVLYLGFFGTVVGFIWYYEGIKLIGPAKASLFINFVPITAIIMAFLILGESITPSLFVGAVFVSTGVLMTTASFKRKIVTELSV